MYPYCRWPKSIFGFIEQIQATINEPDCTSSFFASSFSLLLLLLFFPSLSKSHFRPSSHSHSSKFTMDEFRRDFLIGLASQTIAWVVCGGSGNQDRLLTRAIGELGLEIQTEVLGVPPEFGIFSSGPSFLQDCELFFFVRLSGMIFALPVLLGIAAYLGASRATLGRISALPFAAGAAAWIFFCVVRVPCALLLFLELFLLISRKPTSATSLRA